MIITKFRTQFLPIKILSDGRIQGVLLYPGGPMIEARREEDLFATGGYEEFAHAKKYLPVEEARYCC